MKRLLQDLRYGVRSLVRSWRFTLAASLTLALGIGANAAIFSVIESVLLKPWPFRDPARLILAYQRQSNGASNVFSTQDLLDWKQQSKLLAKMGAHVSWEFNLSSAGAPPERIAGGRVSADLLPVLGVEPMLGRVFSAQEDIVGAGNFVVLSNVLWKDRYGANAGIVGSAIQLDGVPYTVVGIMPAGFLGVDGQELLWTPLQLQRNGGVGASSTVHWLGGYLRLSDGMSLKQARAELDGIAAGLHREDATGDAGFGVDLQTLSDAYTGNVRPALLMLLGCVGFVLLIACANVANLLLARGAARRREMAIRTALGATPVRIVRQLLTESVLLAGAAGAAGVAIAFIVLRGMLALHPPQVPRMQQAGIDSGVLAYTLLISLGVGILFGLVPALVSARASVNDSLRDKGTAAERGFGAHRSVLVTAETALACLLLIGTGLALHSLWALRSVELGFLSQHVLVFRVAAPSSLAGEQVPEFYRQVSERVRTIPGVQAAAIARNLPLSGTDPSMPIVTEGKTPAAAAGGTVTRYRAVGDGYFRTLQIPILQGRGFDEHDTASAPPVAIVSQSLARQYWPGENPIGKQLKPKFSGSAWCAVVGVAADVRHWGADVDIEPTAYYPYTQVPATIRPLLEANMGVAVRSNLRQDDLVRAIQAQVAGIDKNVPVYQVKTMDSMVSDAASLRRFDLSLLGAFSLLALVLAALGVYAVMAYSVTQRTREIGIRIALGASAQDVQRLILAQGARFGLLGSVIGVVGAFALRKVMVTVVYGISANDPVILSLVPVVMVGVVLIACYLPARRAMQIDPIVALRSE